MNQAMFDKLADLGDTPVLIVAQRGHKAGKPNKQGKQGIRWENTPLGICPADEAAATIDKIRESKRFPDEGILVALEGSEHYHGRPCHWYEDADAFEAALAAIKVARDKKTLDAALNKLSDDQLAAVTAYLESKGK